MDGPELYQKYVAAGGTLTYQQWWSSEFKKALAERERKRSIEGGSTWS